MQGKIVKIVSNDCTVLSDGKLYICKPRGKFRKDNLVPLVGDIVEFDEKNNYILEIKPRKNSLIRPSVANIDQVVIITSVKDPDFSSNLLDKLLVIIEYNNIKPIICFTKLDLLDNEEIRKIIDYYKSIGYEIYLSSELDKIKHIFKDKLTVFTGQSGAGKSTLLNKLDNNLNLKTDEISYALGRGKHTTRHVELLDLYGGLVADTPGFSAIDLDSLNDIEIRDAFIEFNHNCKYRDCMHINEDGCEVIKRLNESILPSRYENYVKFLSKNKGRIR